MTTSNGKTCLHQGWSVDSLHPSRPLFNVNNIVSHVIELLDKSEEPGFLTWKKDVESFLQANTNKLLVDPVFKDAPITVIQTILKLPALNVSEDELLHYVVQRAQDDNSRRSDLPCYWSAEEREKALPVMKKLLPHIKLLSLSTESFLRIVEPMNIFNTTRLIQKYRYDALQRHLRENDNNYKSHSFSAICQYYPDPLSRIETLLELRGNIAITESLHPYDAGETELIEEICVGEWAPRMLIEFDRRTYIGKGAELTFYRDRDAKDIIETWHTAWVDPRNGIKSWAVDGCRIFVGFRSIVDAQPCWGWKLFAVPLFGIQDCE